MTPRSGHAAGVATFGEAMGVLRGAPLGSLAHLGELTLGTGGAEGNVAIGLARLGTPVQWLGRVGDDGMGRRVIRELRAEGVAVTAILDRSAQTGLLLKESPAPGTTAVTYYRSGSAGSRLVPSDLAGLEITRNKILHLTGITPALSASAAATVDAALDRAEMAGATISFDVNYRSRLWTAERAAPVLRAIASRSCVVFAGVEEARLLAPDAGENPADLARAIARLGPGEVVIKLGEHGAIAHFGKQIYEQRGVETWVVDTVGAGDAFVAGYLAELAAGLALEERLWTAVRTGAAVCRNPGDWEGALTRRELDQTVPADPVTR